MCTDVLAVSRHRLYATLASGCAGIEHGLLAIHFKYLSSFSACLVAFSFYFVTVLLVLACRSCLYSPTVLRLLKFVTIGRDEDIVLTG